MIGYYNNSGKFWELTFWELTFWEVDILGIDILGVGILGVDILGVDILGRTHCNHVVPHAPILILHTEAKLLLLSQNLNVRSDLSAIHE